MLPDGRRAIVLAIVAALSLEARAAWAQEDVQAQSVLDRPRPEYNATPIYVGAIAIKPTVTTGVSADSNILARNDIVVSDAFLTLQPKIDASLDSALLNVDFNLQSYHARYLSNPIENTDDYTGRATIIYGDTTDTRLDAHVEYSRRSESRSQIDAVSDTAVRGRYEKIVAEAGITQRFGFLSAQLHGGLNRLNYFDVLDSMGNLRDYSYRNFTAYYARGELDYSRSGSSSVFLSGEYRRRDYDISLGNPAFDPTSLFDRSGDSYTIEVGYARQVTSLFYARAGIGYLNYRFDDPRLPGISSLAFDANLIWNVTPLTSIQAYARRSVDETVAPDLAGVRRTEFSIEADHELLRNLILSASARYADLSPIGSGTSSKDRIFRFSATYLANQKWSLTAFVQQRNRSSDNVIRAFDATSIGISATYGF